MIYRFEQFEVDDREFRFSEHGAPLQVEPKVLRLLLYLIENRSRLVRKQELLDTVWQDAMVTENALTRAIGLLRKSLNDDSRCRNLSKPCPPPATVSSPGSPPQMKPRAPSCQRHWSCPPLQQQSFRTTSIIGPW